MEDLGHPTNQVNGLGMQEELELSDNQSTSKENIISQQEALQTELQAANQTNQRMQVELQELRLSQALAEQEATRQQQRAEEALKGFKVAQSRFRQVERERDRQALAATEAKQELAQLQTTIDQVGQEVYQFGRRIHQLEDFLEQQTAQLVQSHREVEERQDKLTALQDYVQWLEQDRQILVQNLARFEQDLRALQASRTVRAASKISKLARGPLRLVRSYTFRRGLV